MALFFFVDGCLSLMVLFDFLLDERARVVEARDDRLR